MLHQRLLGSAEALQKIIDIIPSPVFVKDTDHRWVLLNDALVAMIGRPRDELLGLSDYDIFPPEQAAVFWATDDEVLRTGLPSENEERLTGADGEVRLVVTRKNLLRVGPEPATIFIVGVISDITQYREAQAKSHFLSRHDMLTGLPNRRLFHERLRELGEQASGGTDRSAVLLIDLDGFKAVNDSYGHAGGDELLRVIGGRLSACVRAGDTIARLGGDEFAILLRGAGLDDTAVRVATEICKAIALPIPVAGSQTRVSASVGITFCEAPYGKPEELLRQADVAMYSVKRSGRHGVQVYDPSLEVAASRQLHADMLRALELHQLHVVYQPLWNPPDGELTGYEALLRWEHPHHGNISPGIFIPIAEQSGLIGAYGSFVLKAACAAAMEWPDAVRVSVNVSPLQLVEHRLLAEVEEALALTGLPAARLELEITESRPALDEAGAMRCLQEVRGSGVRIGLDDFGTGTASLDMMHRFGFDRMKIDGRFIRGLPEDRRAHAIVRALIALAHELGALVTAEGVERMEQAFSLMELGCDEMQGYLFGHPNARESIL
jgi:diguanylate cyclase (GGDEF)-like protein/PAS domain S-box-containing protein